MAGPASEGRRKAAPQHAKGDQRRAVGQACRLPELRSETAGAREAGGETSRGREGLAVGRRRLHARAQADRRAAEQRPGRPARLVLSYEFLVLIRFRVNRSLFEKIRVRAGLPGERRETPKVAPGAAEETKGFRGREARPTAKRSVAGRACEATKADRRAAGVPEGDKAQTWHRPLGSRRLPEGETRQGAPAPRLRRGPAAQNK